MEDASLARSRVRRRVLAGAVAVVVAAGAWAGGWIGPAPSDLRDWAPGHSVAPTATIRGDQVTIFGVRAFAFRSADDFTPRYEDRAYDLSRLSSVWYVVTPFGEGGGAAHTFLSFGFDDERFLSISVEARRETTEGYSLWSGLLRRYEVIYVIGDERDLIGLRAVHRGNRVRLYPVRAERPQIRKLFVDMLERANALAERPEFYNTLTNNCMTNILRHVNTLVDPPIRWGPRILLPAHSDQIAFERGLLDTELSLEEARARFLINERAVRSVDHPEFSLRIREVEVDS